MRHLLLIFFAWSAAACGDAVCRLHEITPTPFVWPAPDALKYDSRSPTEYRAKLPWRLRPGVAGIDAFDGGEGFSLSGPLLVSDDFMRLFFRASEPSLELFDGETGLPVTLETMPAPPGGMYGAFPKETLEPNRSYWFSISSTKLTGCGDTAPIVLESHVRPRFSAKAIPIAHHRDRRVLIPFHTHDPSRTIRAAAGKLDQAPTPRFRAVRRFSVMDADGSLNANLLGRFPPLLNEIAYGDHTLMPLDNIAEVVMGELETADFHAGNGLLAWGADGRQKQIPFLLTVPRSISEGATAKLNFRLVLFSHPLRACKEVVLGLANTLAAEGFAVAAIDHIGHGARQKHIPAGYRCGEHIPWEFFAGGEPQGLSNNILTSALDLYQLKKAFQAADSTLFGFKNGERGDLDTTSPALVAMSLGSIIAAPFLAISPDIGVAVLNTPLGTSLELLDAWSPGTSNYDLPLPGIQGALSLALLQTGMEPGEPLSYAAGLRAHPRDLLLQMAAGDAVVPNSSTAKLARALGATLTEPAWVEMDLPTAKLPYTGSPTRALYQLRYANHSFLLLPHDRELLEPARTQVAHFLRTHYTLEGGEVIPIKRKQ